MFTYSHNPGNQERIATHTTIPPAIHIAGILLLIAVTVLCGPLSAAFP